MTGFSVFMAVFVPAALILLGVAVLFLWARIREIHEYLRVVNARQRNLRYALEAFSQSQGPADQVVAMPSFDDVPGEEVGRDN